MSTVDLQQSPQSGCSRKRRRSSSLSSSSSSSSSDVVIILDHDAEATTSTEPLSNLKPPPPPERSEPTVKRGEGGGVQQDDGSQVLEELRQARDVLQRHRGTADAASASGVVPARTNNNEKEMEWIPGLVNRVLSESNREGGLKRSVAMTELLVELVLGFVEPYVMQIWKERMNNTSNKAKSSNMNDGRFLSRSSTTFDAHSTEYRDRAISWAIERIKDLLRPVDGESGTDIPELDALLSASGRYDGLVHERNVQEHLREVLGKMRPMILAAKGDKGSDLVDLLNKSTNSKMAKNNGEDDEVEPTPSPTSAAMCWSVSPEQWMEKVMKNTGIGGNSVGETDSMIEAMESFPYLRTMKDFLKREGA